MHQPTPTDLSRRDFARLLATTGLGAGLTAATISILSITPKAAAQQRPYQQPTRPNNNPAPSLPAGPATKLDGALKPGRTRDWTLKIGVDVRSYQSPAGTVKRQENLTIIPFDFTAASILFPVLASTATSRTRTADVTGSITFDGIDTNTKPTFLEGLQGGGRYARWDLAACKGRAMTIDVEIPMTCWETTVDESRLKLAKWPAGGKWPAVALSTFGAQLGVENGPVVTDLVSQWCNKQSPQSIAPLQLAKFLAAKVLEHVQPNGDGLNSSRTGLLQGFELRGSELTLAEKRGTEHDFTCALAAVYRAAGLPCRTVIGVDVSQTKGQDRGLGGKSGGQTIRSWVEVCFCDENAQTEVWVPVDLLAQRKSSSRAPAADKPWKYFGSNQDTDDIMPVSFHFHPPASVVAHGSPALWGWTTTPTTQVAEQVLRLTSITTPVRPARPGENRP